MNWKLLICSILMVMILLVALFIIVKEKNYSEKLVKWARKIVLTILAALLTLLAVLGGT